MRQEFSERLRTLLEDILENKWQEDEVGWMQQELNKVQKQVSLNQQKVNISQKMAALLQELEALENQPSEGDFATFGFSNNVENIGSGGCGDIPFQFTELNLLEESNCIFDKRFSF